MTDDEVRLLRTGGVGVSAIERLADEALRRGRVIVEAQALHRQAVADRARLEAALGEGAELARAKNGGPMLCERCGHEHERKWSGGMERSPETCIANLRADLEAERARSAKLTADIETGRCCDDYERLTPCGHPQCVVSEICEICHELGVLTHEAEERAARAEAALIERDKDMREAVVWATRNALKLADAEAACVAMRAALEKHGEHQGHGCDPLPDDACAIIVAYVEDRDWRTVACTCELGRALAADAGRKFGEFAQTNTPRTLLTAVRRLMEAAVIAAEALEFVGNRTSIQVRDALADPALVGLQGTGP